jgi:hypothetical protein
MAHLTGKDVAFGRLLNLVVLNSSKSQAMNRISSLFTVLLTFAAIGGAVASTAQSNLEPTSSAVKSSPPATLAQAQTDPFAQTQIKPNVQFNVQRQSGTCPKTVGVWMFMLGFEGGADHTVVADTQAIASAPAKLVVSQPKRLEYEAPLRKEYASCVGQAQSDRVGAYNFQFRNGKVSFRMDVSKGDGYRQILYKGVSASRPYIHWRAAE